MFMNTTRTYFISDTHFGHSRIIEYCDRPYKDTTQMDIDIIHKWNSVVKPNDTVWHLGDFAFFSKKDHERIYKLIQKLNGNINLLLGNHDRHISDNIQFWMDLGFKKVWDSPFLFMNDYILSHEPVISKNGIDLTYHPKLKNIHGHTHNSNADFYAMKPEDQKHWNDEHPNFRTIPDITKHSFNASIEVIDYKPIAFETIIDKMKKCITLL